jgi:predicted MPP superfamily phosphohydrolase
VFGPFRHSDDTEVEGFYWRGRKNAEQIQVRHNHISMKTLPSRFDGFTLLHISDLHVD